MSRSGWKPSALEAQQSGGDRGHALLVVERAAAVEIAVLLAEREGIARPVLAARLDHVHVRHQQDRLAPGRARRRPAHGEAGGLAIGADLDVGDARLAIEAGEIFGELRDLGAALDGRDADRVGIDLARLGVPAVGRRVLGEGGGGGDEEGGGEQGEAHEGTPWNARRFGGIWRGVKRTSCSSTRP